MKKTTRKRITGFLLAGLLVCLPVLQAFAQDYDAGVMDPAPILFPGDTLTGIGTAVNLDGEQVALGGEEPTSWTNQETGKVYRAGMAEDGSISLTLAGYELTVKGGTSSAEDEAGGTVGGHYVSAEEQGNPGESAEDGEMKQDRAYYPEFTIVTIKADAPAEGMEFDKWTVEEGNAVVEDTASSETTVTMPQEKTVITASYRQAQTETEPVTEPVAEIPPETNADPGMQNAPENTDPGATDTPEGMDPGTVDAPESTDPGTTDTPEGTDPGATDMPEGTDPGTEGTSAPDGTLAPEGEGDQNIVPLPEGTNNQNVEIIPDGGQNAEPAPDGMNGQTPEPAPEDMGNQDMGSAPGAEGDQDAEIVPDGMNGQNAEPAPDGMNGQTPEPAPEDMGNQTSEPAPENAGDPNTSSTPDSTGNSEIVVIPAPNQDNSIWSNIDADAIDTTIEDSNETTYSLYVYRGKIVADGTEDGSAEGTAEPKNYAAGTEITVTADDYTENGYSFSRWSVDAGDAAVDLLTTEDPGTVSFTMPAATVMLTAEYVDDAGTPVADPEQKPEAPVTYSVTVQNGAIATEEGLVESADFEAGTSVAVMASDKSTEGLEFAGWNVNSGSVVLEDASAEEITFVMPTESVSLTALYAEIQQSETEAQVVQSYLLDVSYGTVTVDGVAVDAATEPQTYAAGTLITVTADDYTANGYYFQKWGVASDGVVEPQGTDNPATMSFTMPEADVTLTAEYADGNGNPVSDPTSPLVNDVTVQNGAITTAEGPVEEAEFAPDESVTVTAYDKSGEGLVFAGWNVDSGNVTLEDASAEEITFSMPAEGVSLTALYAEGQQSEPPVTSVKVSVMNGSIVTVQDDGTETLAPTNSYAPTTEITLQANAPERGMEFSRWTVKDTEENVLEEELFDPEDEMLTKFTVPADVDEVIVTAEYEKVEYEVTVNDGEASLDLAVMGDKVKITADEAPVGMEFDYWKIDSGNVTLKNAGKAKTSFIMPADDVEVSAQYKMKEYYLTVQNGYSNTNVYYMGQQVTVYSNYPASGREFDKWKAVSGKVSFADSSRWKTTFTMPASDVTVSATYKDGPSPDNNQIWDIVSGGEYITDSTIKFTAVGAGMENTNPNPGDYRYRPSGYQIGNVTGSWQASPYTTSMSIKARGEYTLKVTYNKDVFDGSNWVPDGTTDTKSVTFRVLTPAEAVATGDETPVMMMAVLTGASCLLFLILLVVFVRRRRNS